MKAIIEGQLVDVTVLKEKKFLWKKKYLVSFKEKYHRELSSGKMHEWVAQLAQWIDSRDIIEDN